jgi:hypothetical protein
MLRPLTGLRLFVLTLITFSLAFTTIASAQLLPTTAATTTNRWLVELTGSPTSEGGNASALQKDQNAFRAAAADAKIPYVERKAYNTLFNGFAITATRSAANALGALPGVKGVYPDSVVALDPRAGNPEPDLFWAIQMTGADLVQNDLGITGTGVRVARD